MNHLNVSMVSATQHMGCADLITEDLQHEKQIDKVCILNPFLVGPEVLGANS